MATSSKLYIWSHRGPFLTSPLGANFDPRGEVVPQGSILSPWVEISCLPLHSSKQYVECSPLDGGEQRGGHSLGKISPQGQQVKLRTSLRFRVYICSTYECLSRQVLRFRSSWTSWRTRTLKSRQSSKDSTSSTGRQPVNPAFPFTVNPVRGSNPAKYSCLYPVCSGSCE
jgi:hypothetical protein